MKLTLFSMKWFLLDSPIKKVCFWGILLLLASWNYYTDFFQPFQAFLMAILLTCQVIGMVLIGYLWLGKQKKFPRITFWSITLAFTIFRFLIVFFILQYKLPEWTVFHHPDRVGFYLFFTSAAFIFFGYSYSIYEWGLAARQDYKDSMAISGKSIQPPIVIRSEGKTVRLLPQDIIYLEANGEYVKYCTKGKNHMCFQRMKTAEHELKNYGLLRAHRSYIVNPLFVESYSSNLLILKNNQEIPISNSYRDLFLKTLKNRDFRN
ncbi:LytR/AlgR family response regulator transcription factor [Flagellimonas meridianipacifica]|uniref:LytTr DNA-binding domain-containing protein n=1 Tax=Flagellimonas meridianipacifica TaxID=1080225 RepID=A0A2T0MH44_9FLAO|nr:LytTR family DNA-binding domain-containing protein [Allomuricauda pacifica]PRX56856.1 LytTr DNA-binding domain-containing protein [Allomuricauda pacifica]